MTDAPRHMGVLAPMLSHPAALWTVENTGRPKRKRKPYTGRPFRYLSFGAGVQSSCLLAMTVLGLRDCPRADVALFADTGDEPAFVYRHLAFMKRWADARGLPVLVIQKGVLSEELLTAVSQGHRRYARIPAFTVGERGKRGILRRQCTARYKIDPLQQAVRQLLGVAPKCRVRVPVECMQGISLDEAHRAKDARDKWIKARFPLLDARMTHRDCLDLLRELGLPKPQKSACVFCPFRSDAEWLALKKGDPKGFAKAIALDRAIRTANRAGIRKPIFLHASLKPLEDIDFADHQGRIDFERDHFGNACGGECGV